jgi:hypothetical protein
VRGGVGRLKLHLKLVEPVEGFGEVEAKGEAWNDEVFVPAEFFG